MKLSVKVAVLGLSFLATIGINEATAQSEGNGGSGTNNAIYNKQLNEGLYTNVHYDGMEFSFNDFYEVLAPYGQWIEDGQLGYVWSPDVDVNFRPYFSKGFWAMTDFGNTWVSEYQWGWAVFHYGRWTYDSYYGWLWVPGQDWGPAWVSWRSGVGVFGWAPLSPGYEISNKELNQYTPPKDWWVYLAPEYLYGGDYYRYLYGATGSAVNRKIFTAIDNVFLHNSVNMVNGPQSKQVEEITKKPVKLFHLNNSGIPRADYVHHEIIKMFRPAEFKPVPSSGVHGVPPSVIKAPSVISSKPEAITINGGSEPAFKHDLPGILKNTPRAVAPVRYFTDIKAGSNWYEEHRADKYPYKTDLKSAEPNKRDGMGTITRPARAKVPAQGTQAPERVEIPKEKKNAQPPVNPEQHPDPVPDVNKPKPDPNPHPKQKPEPIMPGSR